MTTQFEKISEDMRNGKRVGRGSNVRRREDPDKESFVLIPLPPPRSIPLLFTCPAESQERREGMINRNKQITLEIFGEPIDLGEP